VAPLLSFHSRSSRGSFCLKKELKRGDLLDENESNPDEMDFFSSSKKKENLNDDNLGYQIVFQKKKRGRKFQKKKKEEFLKRENISSVRFRRLDALDENT
jgi:hypothetical protein